MSLIGLGSPLIQVELLRRKRAGEKDDMLIHALAATIKGIAGRSSQIPAEAAFRYATGSYSAGLRVVYLRNYLRA